VCKITTETQHSCITPLCRMHLWVKAGDSALAVKLGTVREIWSTGASSPQGLQGNKTVGQMLMSKPVCSAVD